MEQLLGIRKELYQSLSQTNNLETSVKILMEKGKAERTIRSAARWLRSENYINIDLDGVVTTWEQQQANSPKVPANEPNGGDKQNDNLRDAEQVSEPDVDSDTEDDGDDSQNEIRI